MNIILHTQSNYALTQFSENTIYDIDNIKKNVFKTLHSNNVNATISRGSY